MNRQMTQGTVANNVQVIPATKRRVSAGGQLKKAKDIRVAAYGRVSTDELAQQTSYEGQKSYYTKLINEKEGWTFAGMYADEVDLCQYFEHKKLKGYADFFNSSSSFCCGVI